MFAWRSRAKDARTHLELGRGAIGAFGGCFDLGLDISVSATVMPKFLRSMDLRCLIAVARRFDIGLHELVMAVIGRIQCCIMELLATRIDSRTLSVSNTRIDYDGEIWMACS